MTEQTTETAHLVQILHPLHDRTYAEAICSCGWESKLRPNENDAKKSWNKHFFES
jgi:hypothetical protein